MAKKKKERGAADDLIEDADRRAKARVEKMMRVYDLELAQGTRDPNDQGINLREFARTYDVGNEVFDGIIAQYLGNSRPPADWEYNQDERIRILTSVMVYRTIPSEDMYQFVIPIDWPPNPEDAGKPVVMKIPAAYIRSRRMQ